MNFDLGPAAEAFRLEVREFLAEHLTDEIRERAWRTGTSHDWGFHRALAARGWVAPSWPASYGGQDRDDVELVAMNEEFALADAPVDGLRTTMLVVETLRHVGSPAQRDDIIPRVLRGELLICLGYSEPDSGSDVASARTLAVRDGDGWVLNGQKMFTSLAHESAYAFVLARTDPTVPKHKGLTMFLVPLDADGVEIRALETLGGQRTNVTYYTDVRLPDSARVGEENGGWRVMTVGLAVERTVPIGPAPMLARFLRWARDRTGPDGRPLLAQESLRARLVRSEIEGEVASLLFRRSVWAAGRDGLPGVESSMAKLYGSETYNGMFARLLDALGPEALLHGDQPESVNGGQLEHGFRYGPYYTIAGGVSEIQREIIAQRGLGLPRGR